MDMNEIRKILELMDANKLVEFEYEEAGKRIRLRRPDHHPAGPAPGYPPAAPFAAHANPAPSHGAPAGAPPARSADLFEFKSPLVGTFFRSPKPDAEPFVNPGDEVGPDKVLCVIEAMKVMNEIKAEMNGVVKEVLVKKGQAVEFGEVLFLIEKR